MAEAWIVGYTHEDGSTQIVDVLDTKEQAETRLEEFCCQDRVPMVMGGLVQWCGEHIGRKFGHWMTYMDVDAHPIAKYVRAKDKEAKEATNDRNLRPSGGGWSRPVSRWCGWTGWGRARRHDVRLRQEGRRCRWKRL